MLRKSVTTTDIEVMIRGCVAVGVPPRLEWQRIEYRILESFTCMDIGPYQAISRDIAFRQGRNSNITLKAQAGSQFNIGPFKGLY